MPYNPVRLQPGIDVQKTPVLNQGGWSDATLIRWFEGLPQKLGGWVKYGGANVGSATRAMHVWQAGSHVVNAPESADLNCLAVGSDQSLNLFINGVPASPATITPATRLASSVAVNCTTTANSPVVTIVATASNLSQYSSINIQTPIAVDGLILYGQYPITTLLSANSFTITANANAVAGVSSGGAVPTFTTVSGSSQVTVTLANSVFNANNLLGYQVGQEIDFQLPTTVGGLTISGVYPITSVNPPNSFTITAATVATSSVGPSGMNGGNASYLYYPVLGPPNVGSGWSIGTWSSGPWSIGAAPNFTPGTPITAPGGGLIGNWTLDNWGTYLIACPDQGPIFYYIPQSGYAQAQMIANSPPVNHGIFVNSQQQILVSYGSTTVQNVHDPLLVRWCDVGNFNQWTPSSTNQAGSYRIPEGSELIAGMALAQQALLWTDIETWSMTYIGPPLVFGFQKIGTGTGVTSRHAAAQLMGVTYWMGQGNFYALDANGIRDLPSPVWDKVFQNINRTNQAKITAAPNSVFNEIGWFYPSLNSTEIDTYVKYSITENAWDYGTLQRSSWQDQSVLGPPFGGDAVGNIFQHETGFDADTAPMVCSITSAWFLLSEGDPVTFVDLILPDFRFGPYAGMNATTAQIQLTIFTADWPAGPVHQRGPYTITSATKWINVRARGRMMRVQLSSSDLGSFWRLGDLRYRGKVDGRRGE